MKKIIATMALALVALPAAAAPTGQVAWGATSVALSSDFTGALGALGVDAAPIWPARITRRGDARFPIPAGALDLETARGDIFHSGGLTLSAGDLTVGLINFVIDTTSEPVLTGLVTVNGDLVGRVPLFDLALGEAPELSRRGRLTIGGVAVTLSAEAADALNAIFNVDAFVEGFSIGEARVRTYVFSRFADDDDEDDDDDH